MVLAIVSLDSKGNDPGPGPTATSFVTNTPDATKPPSPEPTAAPTVSAEAKWIRAQGRLCLRLNEEAAANAAGPSNDVTEQLAKLRSGSTIVRAFVADSAELDAPESFRDQVQVMLGHWGEGAVHMTSMIRAAEDGDGAKFDAQRIQFDNKMESGLRVARELGATVCS